MTSEQVAQGLNLTSKPSRDPADFPDPISMLDCPQNDFFLSAWRLPCVHAVSLGLGPQGPSHELHDQSHAVTPPASHSLDLDPADPCKDPVAITSPSRALFTTPAPPAQNPQPPPAPSQPLPGRAPQLPGPSVGAGSIIVAKWGVCQSVLS